LIESSDLLTPTLDSFDEGETTDAEMTAILERWRTDYQTRVAQLRVEFAALPPPPRLVAMAALQPGIEAILRRSEQGIDQVAAFGGQMAELVERYIDGEISETAALQEMAMRMVRELLEFENGSLAIMQAMSNPGHPNQSIAASRMAFNEALIVVFDAYLRSSGEAEIRLTPARRREMRASAAAMRQHNATGRDAVQTMRLAVEPEIARMSPAMQRGVQVMLASLLETFDTLDGGAALIETAAELREGAKVDLFDPILDRVDEFTLEIERQNAERAAALAVVPAPSL
jgi:hypothetical protein